MTESIIKSFFLGFRERSGTTPRPYFPHILIPVIFGGSNLLFGGRCSNIVQIIKNIFIPLFPDLDFLMKWTTTTKITTMNTFFNRGLNIFFHSSSEGAINSCRTA